MRIVWFDTETSDLPERNPNAEIIAYTTRVWDNGILSEPHTVHLWPCGKVAEEAAKVNGYNPGEWLRRGAERTFDMTDAEYLARTLHDQIVGGHNTNFDLDMVNRTFIRAGMQPPKPNFRKVDTQPCAQLLVSLGLIASASLVNAAKFFGIDPGAAHTSEGDVNMTIQVWERFRNLIVSGLELEANRRSLLANP